MTDNPIQLSNLEASCKLILEELRETSECDNFYFKPIKPKLSDLEVIILIILAEFKSIDSEYQLFRDIKGFEIETKLNVVFIIGEKENYFHLWKKSE